MFDFRGELGFLNCDDVCMCVVNKQFELLEFVFDSVYVDLQCDEIYLTFTAGSVSLCCVCGHVVVFGLSVRMSWYPMYEVVAVTDACTVVCVVCPLQPSSSVNSGCPGPERSILVSSRWACPISSQVTDHWGELRNRTDEVHPVDPFHSLDILKNHSASVAFCRNLGVYNVQNGAVIELSLVVSVKGFPRH